MTIPCKNIVDKSTSRFYHCTTRCVRRAFLCGEDHYSSENYYHQREWIRSRLPVLKSIFAAGLYAYAVMSNHCHVVLLMDLEQVDNLGVDPDDPRKVWCCRLWRKRCWRT